MSKIKDKIKFFSAINEDKKNKKETGRKRLQDLFKKLTFVDSKLDYDLNCSTPEFCIQLLKIGPAFKIFL